MKTKSLDSILLSSTRTENPTSWNGLSIRSSHSGDWPVIPNNQAAILWKKLSPVIHATGSTSKDPPGFRTQKTSPNVWWSTINSVGNVATTWWNVLVSNGRGCDTPFTRREANPSKSTRWLAKTTISLLWSRPKDWKEFFFNDSWKWPGPWPNSNTFGPFKTGNTENIHSFNIPTETELAAKSYAQAKRW